MPATTDRPVTTSRIKKVAYAFKPCVSPCVICRRAYDNDEIPLVHETTIGAQGMLFDAPMGRPLKVRRLVSYPEWIKERQNHGGDKQRILNLLESDEMRATFRPRTADEIRSTLGIDPNSITARINDLQRAGLITVGFFADSGEATYVTSYSRAAWTPRSLWGPKGAALAAEPDVADIIPSGKIPIRLSVTDKSLLLLFGERWKTHLMLPDAKSPSGRYAESPHEMLEDVLRRALNPRRT